MVACLPSSALQSSRTSTPTLVPSLVGPPSPKLTFFCAIFWPRSAGPLPSPHNRPTSVTSCSPTNLTSPSHCPCARHPGEHTVFRYHNFNRNPHPPPSPCTWNFYFSRTLSVNSPLPLFNPIATIAPALPQVSPARRLRMSPFSPSLPTHSFPISRHNSFCRRLMTSRPPAYRFTDPLDSPPAVLVALGEGTALAGFGRSLLDFSAWESGNSPELLGRLLRKPGEPFAYKSPVPVPFGLRRLPCPRLDPCARCDPHVRASNFSAGRFLL